MFVHFMIQNLLYYDNVNRLEMQHFLEMAIGFHSIGFHQETTLIKHSYFSKDLDSDDDKPEADACENGRLEGQSLSETKLSETKEQFIEKLTKKVEPEGGTPEHLLYHFRPNRYSFLKFHPTIY